MQNTSHPTFHPAWQLASLSVGARYLPLHEALDRQGLMQNTSHPTFHPAWQLANLSVGARFLPLHEALDRQRLLVVSDPATSFGLPLPLN
jgi:hypothetical protein